VLSLLTSAYDEAANVCQGTGLTQAEFGTFAEMFLKEPLRVPVVDPEEDKACQQLDDCHSCAEAKSKCQWSDGKCSGRPKSDKSETMKWWEYHEQCTDYLDLCYESKNSKTKGITYMIQS